MAEHSDTNEYDPSDLGGMVDQLLAEVSSVPGEPVGQPVLSESSAEDQDEAQLAAEASGLAEDEAGASAEDALADAQGQVESLASQVDALLAEASSMPSEQPGAGVKTADDEAASPEPEPQTDEPEPATAVQVEAEAIEAEPVESVEDEAGHGDPEPATADPDTPEADVLGEAEPDAAGAEPVMDIDALDEQLAESTGELLEQDELAPEAEPQQAATQQTAPEAAADHEPEPIPAAQTDEADSAEDQPEPATKPASTDAARSRVVRVVEVSKLVYARAEPAALRGAAMVSRPLASRPKIVRDTVGWVGLWTLFLAVCVWFTLVFLRSSETPAAEAEPTALAQPE